MARSCAGASAFLAGGLACLLSGCKPSPPPVPPPEATPFRYPQSVRVTTERYLPLHPDFPSLAAMDREIGRLEAESRRVGPGSARHPMPAPQPEDPGMPAVLDRETEAPMAVPDPRPLADEVRADWAVRRKAEPDRGGEWFQRELDRLRRRFEEQRQQPLPDDSAARLAEAVERSRRLSALELQLERLAETPEDRIRYRPEEVRQRRRERDAARAELALLKREQLEALERALELPVRERAQIPATLIARAEEERDRMRAATAADLEEGERLALERSQPKPLPPPRGTSVLPAPEAHPDTPREELRQRVERLPEPPAGADTYALARRDTIVRLRKQREELRQVLLADVRAAVAGAARERGETVSFESPSGPDRTLALLPAVRQSLQGGGARKAETALSYGKSEGARGR